MRASAEPHQEWFAEEEFWAAFGPFAFGQSRWEKAGRDADYLLNLLDLKHPKPAVLDLCCGPGRFALEFARRGVAVTAVDRSKGYLAELSDHVRAASLERHVEIVHSDIRAFVRPQAFDGAVCVGMSFGYCAHREEDLQVLRNVHISLRAEASFVVEVPTPVWPNELGPWYVVGSEKEGAFIEQEVASGRSRVNSRWHFRRNGEISSFDFSQRLFTDNEIEADLIECGFGNVKLYGGYERGLLDSASRRIVAVAQKVV